jgi:hypothetical protein
MSGTHTAPAGSGRRWLTTCLLGCLGALVLGAVLAISGCVGLYMWINATGTVTEETVLLTGSEEAFGVVYLTPEDEALLELVTAFVRRHRQLREKVPGIHRFLPQKDPRAEAEQHLRQALPIRLEGALYPSPAGGEPREHLVKVEISQQYRWYQLLFSGARLALAFSDQTQAVRVEEKDGLKMVVGRGSEGREHGFTYTGNTFFWGSPPRRVASAAALTPDEPARFRASDPRLPVLLEEVGGDANPIWGIVTGRALDDLSGWLAGEGKANLRPLADLVTGTGTETLAVGFDFGMGRRGEVRIAGLAPRGFVLDEPARRRLATPVHVRTGDGLELELACAPQADDRWSCRGSVLGIDQLIDGLVAEWESQLDRP